MTETGLSDLGLVLAMAAPAGSDANPWVQLIPFALVLAIFYFLILLPMAVTSFDWWKKRLRKNWKRLHRLVYLAGGLVVLHYFWAVKAGIRLPLLAIWILLVLLLIRVPTVKELLIDVRYKLTRFFRSRNNSQY